MEDLLEADVGGSASPAITTTSFGLSPKRSRRPRGKSARYTVLVAVVAVYEGNGGLEIAKRPHPAVPTVMVSSGLGRQSWRGE